MVPEVWTDVGGLAVGLGLLAWQHRAHPRRAWHEGGHRGDPRRRPAAGCARLVPATAGNFSLRLDARRLAVTVSVATRGFSRPAT
jgi:hypothetical protein